MMNSLLSRKDVVELLDLPNEIILAIMNKVKPQALLLSSIIGIGNNRLELLVFDKCHSIDVTSDYSGSSHRTLITRFFFNVMPRICNSIQSLTINLAHICYLDHITKLIDDNSLSNFIHLKIMTGRLYDNTGTHYTSYYYDNEFHHYPLFSTVPQLFYLNDLLAEKLVLFIHCSPFMRSIVSFEYDHDCALSVPSGDKGLFFTQSPHLTHVSITLRQFHDCVCLLNQLGSQLHSFSVSIVHVRLDENNSISQLTSIFCPNLKYLTMTIYRNILHYEQCILPLLQRLSNVEHLTLLLTVGVKGSGPDHFIDGFDLKRDIILYMPQLRQLNFHIRSILRQAPHIESDTICQSFVKYEQSIDCALDYFNNKYGQCQIYSLPFIGNRLDFISNRFPLFDVKNRFSNVTILLLFDDVKSFETVFFERISRALPRLQTLEVINQLEQEEKIKTTINIIEFHYLSLLILHDIHVNYAEQFLCQSRLPCLVELIIRDDALSTIIDQNQQQAKENCSKVETLQIVEPWIEPTNVHLNFFPRLHSKIVDQS
ncbi:unnamed protein product [Rotaria sordida]|uniref:F-box domain-containing protein n=1 Tax=Rotaria sordida TaxID=392033 RepID=A0A819C6Q2_9BILA|nr:unnamed protein product [Rotaria sordida]